MHQLATKSNLPPEILLDVKGSSDPSTQNRIHSLKEQKKKKTSL